MLINTFCVSVQRFRLLGLVDVRRSGGVARAEVKFVSEEFSHCEQQQQIAEHETLLDPHLHSRVRQVIDTTTVPYKEHLFTVEHLCLYRIHYPLPLPYMGKPNPRELQETIRQQKEEIRRLKQMVSTFYMY